HIRLAAFMDDAARIHHVNIARLHAELDDQVQAGNGSRAGAGTYQLDLVDLLVDHFQAVDDGSRGNNGCAVLVIVEDGDLHALAQLLLDIEAFGRLDVFEVDATQGRLQGRNDVDELVRVGFGELDVEYVYACEFLEQAAL